jgi:hypothetical protein
MLLLPQQFFRPGIVSPIFPSNISRHRVLRYLIYLPHHVVTIYVYIVLFLFLFLNFFRLSVGRSIFHSLAILLLICHFCFAFLSFARLSLDCISVTHQSDIAFEFTIELYATDFVRAEL